MYPPNPMFASPNLVQFRHLHVVGLQFVEVIRINFKVISLSFLLAEWSEEKEKASLMEQKCKEEEEKRIESERMLEVEKERQEDRMKQMEKKFNYEMQQQQQEMDRALESKLKEQEELLQKGFKEKADLLGEEIQKLKKENENNSSGGFFKEYLMPLVNTAGNLIPSILTHRVLMKRLK